MEFARVRTSVEVSGDVTGSAVRNRGVAVHEEPDVGHPRKELELLDIRTVFDPSSSAMTTLRVLLGDIAESPAVAWIALPSTSGALVIEHVHGQATTLLNNLVVPEGRGLTGKVFRHGEIDWVEQYASSTSITHEFDTVINAENVVRMLAAPLRVEDGVTGVLTLASRVTGPFGDVEVDHIDALARRLGVALEIARRSRLHAEAAAMAERKRVSEELHDGVGALLFSLNSRAERLRSRLGDKLELEEDITLLQRDLTAVSQEMRGLLAGWHGTVQSDLHAVLLGDAREFEQRSGIRCEVVYLGDAPALALSHLEALAKFVREALLNVEKHANAKSVSLTVATLPTQTSVAIADDGIGLSNVRSSNGIGLAAAVDRISRLGGTASIIEDADIGGVVARATVPR